MSRFLLRAFALGGAFVAAVVVVQGARAAYMEYRAAVPRRGPIPRPDGEPLPASTEDVAFRSKDGHSIRGWWLPGRNGSAIVLAGGTGGDRRSLLHEARLFANAGYSVLVYDPPGHGESEGSPDWVTEIPAALVSALDFMSARPGVERIGAMGFSMGAATVAGVAARDTRIAATVLAGCYTDADEQTRFEYQRWGAIQSVPAIWVMRAFGIGAGALRPIDHVAALSPRPLLLIAGSDDETVPASMAHELYAAAREPKELWLVEGAEHGDFAGAAPEEYERRLVRFFDAALGVKSP